MHANTRSATRLAGFTLIELLVVIAIIAILIELLLSALRERDSTALARADAHLVQMAPALDRYEDRFGERPGGGEPSWADFIAACPLPDCLFPPALADDARDGGYRYTLLRYAAVHAQLGPLLRAAGAPDDPALVLAAEPEVPGLTGMQTRLLAAGIRLTLPAPGAREARERALAAVRRDGVATIGALLRLTPDAIAAARTGEVERLRHEAYHRIDGDGDGHLRLGELLAVHAADAALDARLRAHITTASGLLQLAADDAAFADMPVARIDALDHDAPVVDYPALRQATRQAVTERAAQQRLDAALQRAQQARARGASDREQRAAADYLEQLWAQVPVTVGAHDAAALAAYLAALTPHHP
ncbi:MAG: prepilin-type N-terminal cleavage/methylation domain-containing protein [Pseudomonadota bacterium]